MLVNTKEKVNSPKIGDVVYFQPWKGSTDKRKNAYPVLIRSGGFLSNGRISNFWYWQPLTPTGRPKGEVEHGYGMFFVAEGWKTEVKVTVN